MTSRALALPFLLAAFAPSLPSQVDPELAARIRAEGIERSRVMDTLDRLTNGIGHRLTGSDNFTRACEWAKEEFESYGMEHVELEKWGTWPLVWNRGQWSGRVVSPDEFGLQIATEAWTNGTKGSVSGVIVPLPTTSEELAAARDDLAGKWLLGTLPSRREPFRAELDEALAQIDMLGLLYPSRGDEHYPTRMRVRGDFPRTSEIPDDAPRIMVRRDQYERIEQLVHAGDEVVAEFDVRNRWRDEPIDLHNVIAEIRGTELPGEVVVVCGHLDSWHQATGTTDNGTGVASTLEAARILMAVGAQPKRTIRFCLWGGEEQGLIGSNRHVMMRRPQMEQVSAVYNHDTGTNWAQGLRVTAEQAAMLEPVIAPVLELTAPDAGFEGPVFALDVVERLAGRGGSDHASFLAAGVPAYPWRLEGRSDYFRHTWHSQWDTFDVAIPEYMCHTSTVVALVALGTANLPEKLPRRGIERARGDDLEAHLEGILGCELGGPNKLVVQTVRSEGIGARFGMKPGDAIVAVNGRSVESLLELRRALRRRSGDEAVQPTITVDRDGKREDLVESAVGSGGAR